MSEVKRCDEMERKLRYMESEAKKEKVLILDALDIPKAPNPREIIDLEVWIIYKKNHNPSSEHFWLLKKKFLG